MDPHESRGSGKAARRGALRPGSAALALALCIGTLAASGCVVGPDYTPPAVDLADAWLAGDARAARTDADARWWRSFDDPTLSALVERALVQNLDLRQAGLRVIQGRALRGIAVGEFFPQGQSLFGSASRNRVSENTPAGQGDRTFSDYSIGLQAAWELDFWGRFRRAIEAADAALDASVAEYDDVLILLAADVAANYVDVRSLEEQLALTRANIRAQQDTLELTRLRFEAGAVSELDVSTALGTLASTQSLIPQHEDALRQAKLALCVLLGLPPSDLIEELGPPSPVPQAPAELAVGIPADLLRRRPDVRRAERVAAAACARIGVAKAELYPSFAIAGLTGFHTSTARVLGRAPRADELFDADSFEGFVGLDVDWPILNYGRIKNDVRFADARFQEALVAYESAVLRAASEVETGLSSFLRNRERAAYLAESVTAAQRTAELSLIQYRQGAADFLRVNQAQIDLVDRQNGLVIVRASIAQGAIATYRALGGGWETRVGREFVPAETVEEMRDRTNWGDLLEADYAEGSDLLLFERSSSSGEPGSTPDEAGFQPEAPSPPPPSTREQETHHGHSN